MKPIITISREFGSGGRELGLCLAKTLNLPFYDKELIHLAAKESDLPEDIFQQYEESVELQENPTYKPFSDVYEVPMSDQIFLAQCKVIQKIASQGSCIIVGRCADMVLENSVNLFVYAPMKKRVERLMRLENSDDEKEMLKKVREIDKKRKTYYQYYTGNEWGKAQHFDLCLNTGKVGIEGCMETVLVYLRVWESQT